MKLLYNCAFYTRASLAFKICVRRQHTASSLLYCVSQTLIFLYNVQLCLCVFYRVDPLFRACPGQPGHPSYLHSQVSSAGHGLSGQKLLFKTAGEHLLSEQSNSLSLLVVPLHIIVTIYLSIYLSNYCHIIDVVFRKCSVKCFCFCARKHLHYYVVVFSPSRS